MAINSTYFGIPAEFGDANVPLEKVAPKYFGLSFAEARRRVLAKPRRPHGQRILSPNPYSLVLFATLNK